MPAIDLQELALHVMRRGRCHHAQRDRCECECGGRYHRAGYSGVVIPPELLVRKANHATGAIVRPSTARRRRGQIALPL